MQRPQSQSMLRHFQETDDEEEGDIRIKGKAVVGVGPISAQANCMTIKQREAKKPCDEFFSQKKYGLWKLEQKSGALKLKKHLKGKITMQKLIDEQLGRFQARYMRATIPTKMSNVSQLLKPKWAPPLELAALTWLGDWRPSTILQFILSLTRLLSDPIGAERALSQLINDTRIEEAVIDEEMTEIQANCVLHLPFGPNGNQGRPALVNVMFELNKIHGVMIKAQLLRMKALQLVVKKVLSQTDAAEFLVDFAGIQDAIHRIAIKHKTRKGPVCIKEV